VLPEEEILADIQDAGFAQLADAGYEQYEVSAYAHDKKRARHNVNYWQFGDYLGIGAGAHGKITLPHQQQILRLWKTRLPKHYLAGEHKIAAHIGGHQNSYAGGGEILTAESLPLEFLMNGLRLNEGVPEFFFSERTGLPTSALQPQWQQLEQQGLVEIRHAQLRTTDLGRRFLNRVLQAYTED
jgi:oxygen-independent coproporphyrinogen-3 oxidase